MNELELVMNELELGSGSLELGSFTPLHAIDNCGHFDFGYDGRCKRIDE
jgi:hypothetical protein